MIQKIFKFLFKSGKKATESVGKSMDFIDDVLEKEYITDTVVQVKEASGKVVEKAGQAYQTSKDFIDEKVDLEKIKSSVGGAIEKGKEATSDLAEQMLDKSDTLKNVMNEGKEIIEGFIKGDEEE